MKRWHILLMITLTISLSFGDWVSFKTGKRNASFTEKSDMVHNTNIQVTPNSCNVSIEIPGAFRTGPDHRDERLLKGTETFSVYGSSFKITNTNINGTFRPEKQGLPDLPFIRFQILVPYSVTAESITITPHSENYRELEGTYEVSPIQEQLWASYYAHVHKDNRTFQKNTTVYTTNDYFTHTMEHEIAICHGYKLLEIRYCPMKYNPVTKKILATDKVDFSVKYNGVVRNKVQKPNLFTNAIYRSSIDGITGKMKQPHYRIPRGGKYAIVTAGPFLESNVVDEYIAYRKEQGFEHVKTIDGSGQANGVTNELKTLYTSGLDFVLVIGDESIISPPANEGGDKYHFKPWSRLEGTDILEDVCLSIYLCANDNEFTRIFNRQKWHEEGGEWTSTFMCLAGAEGNENPMGRFSSGHYATRNFDKPDGPYGYKVNRVYACNVVPTQGYGGKFNIPGPFPWEAWVDQQKPWYTNGTEATNLIYKYWNEGAFMIQHRDHGQIAGPAKPKIRMSNAITSKSSPFFLSVNCLTGNYKGKHSNNFAYKTQQNGEIGTCATLAPPPVTYSGDNDLYTMAIYAGMFPENEPPERQLGMAHIFGHLKSSTHSRTYMHIWGDAMTTLSIGDMSPFIKVTTPGNGSEVEQNSVCTIKWADNIKGKVKIELYKGNSVEKVLTKEVASNGSFEWSVTTNDKVGDNYKIKITSIDDPALSHMTDQPFKIIPEFIITQFPYVKNLDNLTKDTEILPEKWVQLADDELQWTVWSGKTPTKEPDQGAATGADGDNTSGTGIYMYVESSGSNNPGKKAYCISPKFNISKVNDPKMSFAYHMFSDNEGKDEMGDLYLDISVDGKWNEGVVHISKNQTDKWHTKEVDLDKFKGKRVIFRFRAITGTGWASDICIDDIRVDGEMVGVDHVKLSALPQVFNVRVQDNQLYYQIPGVKGQKYPVSIKLYNMQGKMIKQLVNGSRLAGYHSMKVNSNLNIASGLYLCKMTSGKFTKTVNFKLMK